ncbi:MULTISPECIES: hypothetical protein, partial [unclassified Burkholderia]|uniref:hypothetical protein n=1 Tax=Burkholderia sp. LMG 13014 TaxID=2709306 RepID=UPI001965BD92
MNEIWRAPSSRRIVCCCMLSPVVDRRGKPDRPAAGRSDRRRAPAALLQRTVAGSAAVQKAFDAKRRRVDERLRA